MEIIMKKLPVNLENQLDSECWTFYKMAILYTIENADVWLSTHMNYYVGDDLAGRFGEFGNIYDMNYFADILEFGCIPVMDTPPDILKERIINELNQNKYVIIYLDYGELQQSAREYIHEILVYGYNDEGFFCPILKKGKFRETIIPFERFKVAYTKRFNQYLSDGWNLLCTRNFYFGITTVVPKTDYKNDNLVFEFIKKLRNESLGNKIIVENKDINTEELIRKTYYQGTTALIFFSQLFNEKESLYWTENRLIKVTSALKTAFDHRMLLLKNMEFICNYLGATQDAIIQESVNQYKDLSMDISKMYMMVCKYRQIKQIDILKRIGKKCMLQYDLERSILQKFEDALWPYYYSFNKVVMLLDE